MPAPDKNAAKQPSKAVIIRGLQQVLDEKQREYDQLLEENVSLRTREVRTRFVICCAVSTSQCCCPLLSSVGVCRLHWMRGPRLVLPI